MWPDLYFAEGGIEESIWKSRIRIIISENLKRFCTIKDPVPRYKGQLCDLLLGATSHSHAKPTFISGPFEY